MLKQQVLVTTEGGVSPCTLYNMKSFWTGAFHPIHLFKIEEAWYKGQSIEGGMMEKKFKNHCSK